MNTNVVIMGDIPKGTRIGIVCGGQSPALSEAIKTAVEKCFAPKGSEETAAPECPVKYYRVTAYTMYCGEHMTDYIATADEDELQKFAQNLCEDNAAEWEPYWADYAEEGYDSEEDWQEAYYSDCDTHIEEITEAEYKEETKGRWPFELVKEGPGWDNA